MTCERFACIEPLDPSNDEVDEYLRHVEGRVDVCRGAGFPTLTANKNIRDEVKPNAAAPVSPAH